MGKEANILLIIIFLGSEGSFVFNFGSLDGGKSYYFLNYYIVRCKYFVTY